MLVGTANGEVALNGVMSDEQVPIGEKVLTSGGDQIFPKGLPVGTVTKVGTGKDLFLNIKIKPAADLGKLEEVLVLVEKQERQVTPEENVRVRAADILAQRLPSVPDKPASDAKPAASAAKEGTKPAVPNTAAKPAGAGVTTAPAVRNPSGASSVPTASTAGQSGKAAADRTSTVPKNMGAAGGTVTEPKPDASQTTPATAPPKPAEPSSPPPANPQPPASEASPQ